MQSSSILLGVFYYFVSKIKAITSRFIFYWDKVQIKFLFGPDGPNTTISLKLVAKDFNVVLRSGTLIRPSGLWFQESLKVSTYCQESRSCLSGDRRSVECGQTDTLTARGKSDAQTPQALGSPVLFGAKKLF